MTCGGCKGFGNLSICITLADADKCKAFKDIQKRVDTWPVFGERL